MKSEQEGRRAKTADAEDLLLVAASLKLPPGEVEGELRKELAIALYARGALSVGKAAEFSGMTRWAFKDLLGERRIPRHYGREELEEDLAYGLGERR